MSSEPAPSLQEKAFTHSQFVQLLKQEGLVKHLFEYSRVIISVYRWDTVNKPFFLYLSARLISRRNPIVVEEEGRCVEINFWRLVKLGYRFATSVLLAGFLLAKVRTRVRSLQKESGRQILSLDLRQGPVYLRTDYWFGLKSGGSISHTTGVLNNLREFCGQPIFFSTDWISEVDSAIETHLLPTGALFWDLGHVSTLALNGRLNYVLKELGDRKVSFVYQRYSRNNFLGLQLARARQIPLVLEYNGSETWISRNWDKEAEPAKITGEIENLNLLHAQLIVVVSEVLKTELIGRGLEEKRILVNLNGVDPDRYSPQIDGTGVRARLGLPSDAIVVGFIGTFGPWHGAEVLAKAAVLWVASSRDAQNIRFLFIGDGPSMPAVRKIVRDSKLGKVVCLAGSVPQAEGPAHLAACDILVAPHVPNPDGSPFFGSPTKLFEYMAMGKGIVASRLGQLGQVLEDDKTALLAAPGDPQDLVEKMRRLTIDPGLRARLGLEARSQAVEKYSWKGHTGRILDRLKSLRSITS